MEDVKLVIDTVTAIGILGAFGAGVYQARQLVADARERDRERRIERALNLYRDLVVESDTATAFHQLSLQLRAKGFEHYGTETWYMPAEADLRHGGLLDPTVEGREAPFQNLYKVLWFFERAQKSLDFNLVDPEVTYSTIGYHFWWWGQVLLQVRSPKASAALRRLAANAEAWARNARLYDEWVERCLADFGNAKARPL